MTRIYCAHMVCVVSEGLSRADIRDRRGQEGPLSHGYNVSMEGCLFTKLYLRCTQHYSSDKPVGYPLHCSMC